MLLRGPQFTGTSHELQKHQRPIGVAEENFFADVRTFLFRIRYGLLCDGCDPGLIQISIQWLWLTGPLSSYRGLGTKTRWEKVPPTVGNSTAIRSTGERLTDGAS